MLGAKYLFVLFSFIIIINVMFPACIGYDHKRIRLKKFLHSWEFSPKERNNIERFGTFKVLSFKGKSFLFVGGRNAIYKFDNALNLVKKTDDSNALWYFTPVYNRTYQSGTQLLSRDDSRPVYSTIDSCLSFTDRVRVRLDVTDPDTKEAAFRTYPGAGMRFMAQWIRFRKQYEDYVCNGSFIRGLAAVKRDNVDYLWACGTFGSFPKSILLNPETLEIIRVEDETLPTCARWPDEPMVTSVVNDELYVGSGWGLYKPDLATIKSTLPNQSTMLYSDWKMLASGHHWFTRMAMVLGRDVVFIPRTFENKNYIYFIGHEVTPSLSYINSLTREVTQSFLLRICKNDIGFKYTAEEDLEEVRKWRNISYLKGLYTDSVYNLTLDQFYFSYSSKAYDETYHVPTKHFVSARKFPFGCYLKRYDGAQSLNRFWGEQNIVYFNRLADANLSFTWVDERGIVKDMFGEYGTMPQYFPQDIEWNRLLRARLMYDPNSGVWNPMVAAFSSPGMWKRRKWRSRGRQSTGEVRPKGAICQFHISEWKTDAKEKERDPPPPNSVYVSELQDEPEHEGYRHVKPKNKRQFPFARLAEFRSGDIPTNITIKTAAQEFMAYYGSEVKDFFSRVNHWFQGGQIPGYWGLDLHAVPKWSPEQERSLMDALDAGQCLTKEKMKSLTKDEFLRRMKHASTAWPTEWDTTATKYFDAVYHMNPMQVAGDNASFVYDGVEFAKMFVMKSNFTDYKLGNDTRPLLYLMLVSTEAEVFSVVMCDIMSIPIKFSTCEMNHTDQPYVTKMFQYMRRNRNYVEENLRPQPSTDSNEKFKQFRVSSLLSVWRTANTIDENVYPHDEDWQAPILKDAHIDEKDNSLTLMTSVRLMKLDISTRAICSSYKACIHCASDPMCSWNNIRRTCMKFKENPQGVQDVLNRGYLCETLIKNVNPTRKTVVQTDLALILSCDNWKYFRGSIRWRLNETNEIIDSRNSLHRSNYSVSEDDNSLIVSPNALNYLRGRHKELTFVCFGVSMDNSSLTRKLASYVIDNNEVCDRCGKCNEQHRSFSDFKFCVEAKFCTKRT